MAITKKTVYELNGRVFNSRHDLYDAACDVIADLVADCDRLTSLGLPDATLETITFWLVKNADVVRGCLDDVIEAGELL